MFVKYTVHIGSPSCVMIHLLASPVCSFLLKAVDFSLVSTPFVSVSFSFSSIEFHSLSHGGLVRHNCLQRNWSEAQEQAKSSQFSGQHCFLFHFVECTFLPLAHQ